MQREDEMLARLEVALYASGRPLSIEDIQSAIGTDSRSKALKIARMLAEKVNSTFHALEVVESPSGSFVLQVKPSYYSIVRRFSSKPLLSKAALRTLAYIAYMQPVNVKRLAEVRGSQVYEHLRELRSLGFISYRVEGRSKMYYTTDKFAEYFGIASNGSYDGKELRAFLINKAMHVTSDPLQVDGAITTMAAQTG